MIFSVWGMSTVLTSVSKFVVCQLVYPIKIQLFCYQPKIDFGSHLVENTHKKKTLTYIRIRHLSVALNEVTESLTQENVKNTKENTLCQQYVPNNYSRLYNRIADRT